MVAVRLFLRLKNGSHAYLHNGHGGKDGVWRLVTPLNREMDFDQITHEVVRLKWALEGVADARTAIDALKKWAPAVAESVKVVDDD